MMVSWQLMPQDTLTDAYSSKTLQRYPSPNYFPKSLFACFLCLPFGFNSQGFRLFYTHGTCKIFP